MAGLALFGLACGASRTPAAAPAAPTADAAAQTASCPQQAPDMIVALRDAARRRDWAAWRALLSAEKGRHVPEDSDAYFRNEVMSAWARDLAGVDVDGASLEDDGIALWVVNRAHKPELVLKVSREAGCLRLDEN